MAHDSLFAPDGEDLPIDEIIRRLKLEFAYVETDHEAARRAIEEQIAWLSKLKASGRNCGGRDIDTHLEYTTSLKPHAIMVTVADSKNHGDAYLTTILTPESGWFFGYESMAH